MGLNRRNKMGLIDWVKNLVAKFWAGLERFVAAEAKHMAEQKAKEKVKEKVTEKVEEKEEDVKEVVSEAVGKVKKKAATKAKAVRKRARTSYGKYIADDPTTTKKNEAYEDE